MAPRTGRGSASSAAPAASASPPSRAAPAGLARQSDRQQAGPALDVAGVSVTYGKFIAVEHASFTVHTGECVAMVGPNGSGKSSLGMAVAGLVPARGSIRVDGRQAPLGDAEWMARHGVILVPERRQLFPDMSVEDNILLGCYPWTHSLRKARRSATFEELYTWFPALTSRRKQLAGTMSGGEQQMVALARGLASRPRVLIIDEPCLGLAEAISVRVYELLRQLTEQGQTVLLIEEDPYRALQISHRVVQVERGLTRTVESAAASPADEGPATGEGGQ
jgi:branched-chain amino acid transport system ATP-binding protein